MVANSQPADIASGLGYLPDQFSEDDSTLLNELASLAVEHIEHDPESTVNEDDIHQVAQTLIEAACDARTIMIFFMSLLNQDEVAAIKHKFDNDIILAAKNVAIIRLLSASDSPTQMPIRKVLLRQLVLKVTHDVRVIMIKIAGRLVVLRNAELWDNDEIRRRIAQEALDVVVPWCDALGLDAWRKELQELSFKYLEPEKYNYILDVMRDQRDVLHDVKDQVTQELKSLIKRHNMEAHVTGRVKTHYAVLRKMEAYEISYDEVWDRIGIRILTNSVFDCYYIQTAIEEELYTQRRRYVDYIENPRKPYNYQSLHLTVGGPRDISVEIQIRTYDMHIKGEFGVAAHWKMYGGGEGADTSEDIKFAFLRTQASQLLGDPMEYLGNTLDTLLFNNSILPTDSQGYVLDPDTGERLRDSEGDEVHYRNAMTNDKGYILDPYTGQALRSSQSNEFIWYQSEILPDRVLVYTPQGDLKSLPNGATPLDFAYYIHEGVGHSCIGAKINGQMEKLDYTLQMGDRVAIVTRKGNKPSLDWLYNGYSKTRRAHDKIKRYFREKTDVSVPEVEELGHSIIKKRMSAHKIRDLSIDDLAERLKCRTKQELLECVGSSEISVKLLDDALGDYLLESLSDDQTQHNTQIHVSNKEFALLYQQAQCCLPVPGDDAISYITQGRGFTLHRADCRNAKTLDQARVSYFDWPEYTLCENGHKPPAAFISKLILLVVAPSKTILYIKEIATQEGLPIESIRMARDQDHGTQVAINFRIACRAQIDKLIRKLNSSDDILMIRRPMG